VIDKGVGCALTSTPVLGCDIRYNGGERFAFRLSDDVSVSLVSVEEKMRLLNVADPDESAAEFDPLEDSAPSASVMVTVLVPGANTEPLSVRVTAGAGETGTPTVALEGGSVVMASA